MVTLNSLLAILHFVSLNGDLELFACSTTFASLNSNLEFFACRTTLVSLNGDLELFACRTKFGYMIIISPAYEVCLGVYSF